MNLISFVSLIDLIKNSAHAGSKSGHSTPPDELQEAR